MNSLLNVVQDRGDPLSPILFNLFINNVLNKYEKYGVNIGNSKCCGSLFADDIILIAPSEKKLQKLLNCVSFAGPTKMKCILVLINALL